ncbi:MAG: riboflavin synthase [Alphaproteobacteria bacterium]|nr:riboflavin synthase [Alphaproteobacteria bacterium]
MFTGIITDVGTVSSVLPGGNARVTIATHYDMARVALGDSIACAGVCLTVVEKGAGWFAVEVSPETCARTTAGSWAQGTKVNLEQALRMGDALGGHMVSGHVDGLAEIVDVSIAGGAHVLTLAAPAPLAKFIAEKGSVTLDGVSLTVNAVQGVRFTVNIIPHTLQHTTLGDAVRGARLNLEVDMLARYVERLLADSEG